MWNRPHSNMSFGAWKRDMKKKSVWIERRHQTDLRLVTLGHFLARNWNCVCGRNIESVNSRGFPCRGEETLRIQSGEVQTQILGMDTQCVLHTTNETCNTKDFQIIRNTFHAYGKYTNTYTIGIQTAVTNSERGGMNAILRRRLSNNQQGRANY